MTNYRKGIKILEYFGSWYANEVDKITRKLYSRKGNMKKKKEILRIRNLCRLIQEEFDVNRLITKADLLNKLLKKYHGLLK